MQQLEITKQGRSQATSRAGVKDGRNSAAGSGRQAHGKRVKTDGRSGKQYRRKTTWPRWCSEEKPVWQASKQTPEQKN